MTFPFHFAKLLSNAAEPGGQLPLTDCALAERGLFVNDGAKLLKSVMGVSGVMDWARSCLKEFLSILLIERSFGNVKLT